MKDEMKAVTRIKYPGYRPWYGDKRDKRKAIQAARRHMKSEIFRCLKRALDNC